MPPWVDNTLLKVMMIRLAFQWMSRPRDICKTCQVNLKHIPVLILFRGCDPLLFWRCSHMMRPERMSSSRPSAFFCHPSLPYTFMHATFILYAQKFPDMQNISRQQPWRTGGFFFLWPTGWPPGRVKCFIAAPGVVLVSIFQLNNCWIQRDKSWYGRILGRWGRWGRWGSSVKSVLALIVSKSVSK